jgi:signal transduction histidine kinase
LADIPHVPSLGALLWVTSEPTLVTDFNGRIVEANPPAEVLLGRSRDALLGRAFIETAVPERLRLDAAAALVRLVAQPARLGVRERLATWVLLPNGEELAVSVDAVASHAPDPALVFVSAIPTQACVDGAAEPEPTRTQLRSLMTSLLVAEERERRRLAQDLHDGLSQLLALAQMKVAALSRATRTRSSEQHKALDEIQALIVSADRSARSIGCELSPPSLHQLGLVPALRWLVESLHERYGVAIQFTDPEPFPTLDETRNVVLFRSVRELLINAAKHAQASSVELSLREAFGRLVVRVRDDGVGMRNDIEQSAGTGLVSMRERLAHIGGALRIKSQRGAGTSIEIELILPVTANQPGSVS